MGETCESNIEKEQKQDGERVRTNEEIIVRQKKGATERNNHE